MKKAMQLQHNWKQINIHVKVRSWTGPTNFNVKLMIVKLLNSKSTSSPSLYSLIWPKPVNLITFRINRPMVLSSFSLTVTIRISTLSVSSQYFGNLCLGHGRSLKSWGEEYTKLITWGMKNNNNVLLKCPRIATTANVIPLK